ncbi:MAG TPA: hypothetical protein VMN58_08055 [Acidimicrobiales bacterium]|nr:hypothetical protein [Acidimicrobiales bacterium]
MAKPQQAELRRSGFTASLDPDSVASEREARDHPGTSAGPDGPVPEDNLPGHHPDEEQDKPSGDDFVARAKELAEEAQQAPATKAGAKKAGAKKAVPKKAVPKKAVAKKSTPASPTTTSAPTAAPVSAASPPAPPATGFLVPRTTYGRIVGVVAETPIRLAGLVITHLRRR